MHSDRDLRDQLLNALGVRPDSVLRTGSADKASAPADEPPGAGELPSACTDAGGSRLSGHRVETVIYDDLKPTPSLHDVMLGEVDEAVYENAGTHLMAKYFGIHDTLVRRAARYGDFSDNALISQQLKQVIMTNTDGTLREGYKQCSFVQREALEMIAQKIARILNGDSDYKDNWHDIQGYARLAEARCKPRD